MSNFLGSENFYAYEGDITIFYRKFVVSQFQKFSCGNLFVFHEVSGIEKNHGLDGGNEYHDYPSRIFCLIVLKNSVGERFRM